MSIYVGISENSRHSARATPKDQTDASQFRVWPESQVEREPGALAHQDRCCCHLLPPLRPLHVQYRQLKITCSCMSGGQLAAAYGVLRKS